MKGADETPMWSVGNPFITSGVFKFTTPSLPNPGTSLPVFASSAMSSPSSVAKKISGPDVLSPGQYSRLRMDPSLPENPLLAVYSQMTAPVSGTSATTRLNGNDKYITPLTTIGIDWLGRNGRPSFCIEKVHAGTSVATLLALICVNGEYRCAPLSLPNPDHPVCE